MKVHSTLKNIFVCEEFFLKTQIADATDESRAHVLAYGPFHHVSANTPKDLIVHFESNSSLVAITQLDREVNTIFIFIFQFF